LTDRRCSETVPIPENDDAPGRKHTRANGSHSMNCRCGRKQRYGRDDNEILC
jgi:hypothetical protein